MFYYYNSFLRYLREVWWLLVLNFQEEEKKWTKKKDGKKTKTAMYCRDSKAPAKNSCPICPTNCPTTDSVLVHIATSHYKDQLLKSYTVENPTTCKICVKNFQSCYHLLRHVVLIHHGLKNILKTDVYQKLWDKRTTNSRKVDEEGSDHDAFVIANDEVTI